MPMEEFLKTVDGHPEELEALGGILAGHGMKQAIDLAYVEESMVNDVLGERAERAELAELLRAAVAHARPPLSAGGSVR